MTFHKQFTTLFLADVCQEHLPSFCDILSNRYLLSREEIEVALQQKTYFTLVHLESLLKVVVTLPAMLTIGQNVFHRKQEIILVEGQQSISVLSPEQLLLQLLEAFKKSNEKADDTWYDLLGIMKIQNTDLDIPFLMQQSTLPGVSSLLAQALLV